MSKKTMHYVIKHSCGPQECDCRPVCHQREGDEILITANASNVTCGNCLRAMAKRKVLLASDQVARLQGSKSIGDWQEALQLLRDVVMQSEDAVDERNGETVKSKCRKFLARHDDAL